MAEFNINGWYGGGGAGALFGWIDPRQQAKIDSPDTGYAIDQNVDGSGVGPILTGIFGYEVGAQKNSPIRLGLPLHLSLSGMWNPDGAEYYIVTPDGYNHENLYSPHYLSVNGTFNPSLGFRIIDGDTANHILLLGGIIGYRYGAGNMPMADARGNQLPGSESLQGWSNIAGAFVGWGVEGENLRTTFSVNYWRDKIPMAENQLRIKPVPMNTLVASFEFTRAFKKKEVVAEIPAPLPDIPEEIPAEIPPPVPIIPPVVIIPPPPPRNYILVALSSPLAELSLNNITFVQGSYVLTPAAKVILDEVATQLNSPEGKIFTLLEVAGYASTEGSASLNKTLSQHRAEAVVNYLVSQGVSESRLIFKGYGESVPLYAEKQRCSGTNATGEADRVCSENGHSENKEITRRVVFRVIKSEGK